MRTLRKPAESTAAYSRLLIAAAHVFAERGFENTTTKDISDYARVNSASVNYYFDDKIGLYTAVLTGIAEKEAQIRPGEDLSSVAPDEALRGFIRRIVEACFGPAPQAAERIILHEIAHPTPGLTSVVQRLLRPRTERLSAMLAPLMNCHATAPAVQMAAYSVLSQLTLPLHSAPLLRALFPCWREEAFTERLCVHIQTFCLAAISTSRPARVKAA